MSQSIEAKKYEYVSNLHRMNVDSLISSLAVAMQEIEQLKAQLAETKELVEVKKPSA